MYIIVSFLLSLIFGLASYPLILDFCQRKGFYDIPNERKVHPPTHSPLGWYNIRAEYADCFLNNHAGDESVLG